MESTTFIEGLAGILTQYMTISTVVFVRYAIIAGIGFILFYGLFRKKKFHRKIQQKYPKANKVWAEVKHSAYTALIFGFLGMVIKWMGTNGWTSIYTDFYEYGILYAVFSFVLIMFIHDTYFYWMHYAMHKVKPLMKFHAIHHQSRNPTPWAAMAFHPVEALAEYAFVPFVVMLIPFHPMVLFTFAIFSFIFNVIGHLGFEIFPKGTTRHPIGKWFNTATHHNMHHKNGNGNFGLYFNIWDTVMKTNHQDYFEKFDEVVNRPKETKIGKVDEAVLV